MSENNTNDSNKLEGRIEELSARSAELARVAEVVAMTERHYRAGSPLWDALIGEARSGYTHRDGVLGTGKGHYAPGEAPAELAEALEGLAADVRAAGAREVEAKEAEAARFREAIDMSDYVYEAPGDSQ